MLAPTELVSALEQTRAIVADPDRWIAGEYETTYPHGKRFCLVGALRHVCARINGGRWASTLYDDAYHVLATISRDLYGGHPEQVNDAFGQKAAIAIVEKAIGRAAGRDTDLTRRYAADATRYNGVPIFVVASAGGVSPVAVFTPATVAA